ncbi:DNA repair protein RecO [Chitinimonas arctica]|uniref:DNA repair protein RecO n=1 Tax=Chitinimonas arctica TaxID=2594795 RepID=A0A516SBL1_9NEIS|nr:DNA repair protein RecO [Chitinimonas arctica]QDQ25534.1 DNA repair protein RecO [Chitinimonas arctica]
MAAVTFARSKQRVEATPCWLLHSYPYKETSLIVEVLSRQHGRVALVARGARRPTSSLRGNLLAFQPLMLSWFGGGELKTLHAAEWQGGVAQLTGLPLICGFYLNELLLRLVPREDAHPGLFDAYRLAAIALAKAPTEVEPVLRRFELTLLTELGYGLTLARDLHGQPVEAAREYRFLSGRGIVPANEIPAGMGVGLSGRSLAAMAAGDYSEPQSALQAKQLMRVLLAELLGDAPLHTRKILRDLHKL